MRPVLLALTLASPPPAIDVDWHGDPTCPSDQIFRGDLATHLQAGEATTPVHARVAVRHADAVWSLTLTLTTPDGESTRELTGASCSAVSAAAAFITAFVIDPALLTRTTAPEPSVPDPPPAPPPAPEPQPEPPPAPEPQPDPPIPPRPRLRWFVRLAGGLEALATDRIAPQLSPALGLLARRWRVEATALYRAPTRHPVADGAFAVQRQWTLGLRGCGAPRTRRLDFPLCLGLEAGQVVGDGDGASLARTARARLPWLALVAAPAITWSPRPWLALWAGLDLAVPLLRGRFVISDVEVHRTAPVSLRAGLGLEARFP